ncbi:MAG: M48 family metalloprotease [Candidatus Hydrogenedentes bacterium]|nr:M48 family metalloprotease [Candidatus Hydrogenedentota bacterium]
MNTLAEFLIGLPFVDAVLVKATVLLAVAWLIHLALWRRNPRWRVLLWRSVILGLLALPFAEFTLPAVEIALHSEAAPSTPPTMSALEAPVEQVLISLQPSITASPMEIFTPSESSPPFSATAWLSQNALSLLLFLWGAGALLSLLQMTRGWIRVQAAIRLSTAAPVTLVDCAREVAQRLGIRQPVKLRILAGLGSPFQTGMVRPVIVLSDRALGEDDVSQVRAVLAHELAHVKSRDTFWMSLARVLSALLWFHPLQWGLRSAHGSACEEVCDAVAADLVGGAESYARALALEALAVHAAAAAPGGVPMLGSSEIMHRLHRLRQGIRANALAGHWVAVASAAGITLLAALGSLRLVQEPAEVFGAEIDTRSDQSPAIEVNLTKDRAVATLPGLEVELLGVVGAEPTLISVDGRQVEPRAWGNAAETVVTSYWSNLLRQQMAGQRRGTNAGFLFRLHPTSPAATAMELSGVTPDLENLDTTSTVTAADESGEASADRYVIADCRTDLDLELPDHIGLRSNFSGEAESNLYAIHWNNVPMVENTNARFRSPRFSSADIIAASYQVDGEPWWPRFQEVYAPNDGAIIRLIKQPRGAVAQDFFSKSRSGGNAMPDVITLRWDRFLAGWPGDPVAREKDVLATYNFSFNGGEGSSLRTLPAALTELTPADIQVADSVPDTIIRGDWSIVEDAPLEERMKALETILSEEAGTPIHFESPDTAQIVVVARGSFSFQPIADPPEEKGIYIYGGNNAGGDHYNYGAANRLSEVFEIFSSGTHVAVINQVNQPDAAQVPYAYFMRSARMAHGEAATPEGRRKLDQILGHLAEQTGLEFTVEHRTRKLWRMTAVAAPNANGDAPPATSDAQPAPDTETKDEPGTPLAASEDPAGKTRTLRFRFVDENNSPLPGIRFVVYGQTHTDSLRRGTANDEGRYVWEGAPSETMEISFSHPTGAQGHEVLPLQEAENIITFETPRLATFRGSVVDAETGSAVPDYEIWIGTNTDGSLVTTMFSGTHWSVAKSPERKGDGFELKIPKREQDITHLRIAIVSDGYFIELSPLFPQDAPPDMLNFKMEKAAPVEGQVLDAAGVPVRGAKVHLASEDFVISMMGLGNAVSRYDDNTPEKRENARHLWVGKNHVVVFTPEDGRFKLPALRPPYDLVALDENGYVRKHVTAPESNHELRLEPCATLTIGNAFHERLTDIGMSPASETPAWFFALPTRMPDMRSPRLVMENLPPGRYFVHASYRSAPGSEATSSKGNRVSRYVTLASGEAGHLTTLENGPEVSGKLSLPDGMSADVELRNDRISISSNDFADGILRFYTVPPGQYRLVARLYAADTPDDVRRVYTEYEYPDFINVEERSLEHVDLGDLRTTEDHTLALSEY